MPHIDCRYDGYSLSSGSEKDSQQVDDAHVPRVALDDISALSFFRDHVSARRPCVITGHPDPTPLAAPATAAASPTASKRPRREPTRLQWPDSVLCDVAGTAHVAVEVGQADAPTQFGHAKCETIPFADFIQRLQSGDESIYLTAQTTQRDDNARPHLCAPPAEQLVQRGHAPLHVPLMGELILAQINVWMGTSRNGASSGLHHDFHDNLYMLVRGTKRFQLWSPDAIGVMAVSGEATLVHPNGRVCYRGEETAADGSWIETTQPGLSDGDDETEGDDAADNLDMGEFPDVSDDDDAALEAALDAAIDGTAGPDDFEEDECSDSPLQGTGGTSSEEQDKLPKNFSTLDKQPGGRSACAAFVAAPSVTVTIRPGDMLYLPCGWFHEVTSIGATTEGGHLALNYWYHPPDNLKGDVHHPYTTDFWRRDWTERCRTDPTVKKVVNAPQ
eukprot:m.214594 g.214594  ORF g.214594 m.214594 type:complete len:445 (-) comp27243_c0_seq1:145-1479(-)